MLPNFSIRTRTRRFVASAYSVAIIITLVSTQTPAAVPDERMPDLSKVFIAARARRGKRPIILVPGILSTKLINSKTGETVWPSAFRSGDDELSLPINGDPLNSRDNLVATKAIETTRFLPLTPKVNILGGMLEALRNHAGYKEGDWEHPAPDGDRDTFYTFVYDWRLDNVQMAQQLITRIAALKSKLNQPDLRFDVIAISMGGLIARYAAMYGAQDLPRNGAPPILNWAGAAHIGKLLMFGVPNEGSMEAFATILNGYSINEGANEPRRLFRKLSREDAFSGLAVFQLMPHGSTVRFLNQDLQPVKIDLYDGGSWKLYGWSIAHDAKYIKRFKEKTASNHSNLSVLEVHLAAILDRTRRFHEALDARLEGPAPIPLLAFAGDCEDTLNAAVVFYDKKKSRWVTVTSPKKLRASNGQTISREHVQRAMYVPGDGRVTRASVLAETLSVAGGQRAHQPLPVAHSFFACGGHGSLHNNRILLNNALSILVR
ncbi:MAG TPA: hypothetical protein VJV03_11050 [Pyrinomonadaceae bacterium]|nr:hypothetical protein [Pyrinomonadaceae bacterium]